MLCFMAVCMLSSCGKPSIEAGTALVTVKENGKKMTTQAYLCGKKVSVGEVLGE